MYKTISIRQHKGHSHKVSINVSSSLESHKDCTKGRPDSHDGRIPGVQKPESQTALAGGSAQQTGNHIDYS